MRMLVFTQEGRHIKVYFKKRKQEEVFSFLADKENHIEEVKATTFDMIKHDNVNNYEAEWNRLRKRYDDIQIFFLSVEAIGELIPRYIAIKNREGIEERRLCVYIPDLGYDNRVCNDYLLEYISRDINLVKGKELYFWLFVFQNHGQDVTVDDINRYSVRGKFPVHLKDAYTQSNLFSQIEEENGYKQLAALQISEEYVCFGARTATYNQATLGHDFDYSFRNMEFGNYELSMKYLKEMSIQAIKMGRMEQRMNPMDNCIDYAGEGANDFMDLFLVAHSKFMVVNATGMFSIASMFTIPLLMVNATLISAGLGGFQYTQYDLYIPKKYYSEKKKRLLTLEEIVRIEAECMIWGRRYEQRGIKFIDNTPEEIRDAVEEMLQRLRGVWVDTEEDIANYRRYLEIYEEMKKISLNNEKNWIGEPIPYRLATSYLRNNLYLLST